MRAATRDFIWRPDSTRIAREVDAHARLAPYAGRTAAARVALALGFGDSSARANAGAALDTLSSATAMQVYEFLAHPRFAGERQLVFSAIDPLTWSGVWAVRFLTTSGEGRPARPECQPHIPEKQSFFACGAPKRLFFPRSGAGGRVSWIARALPAGPAFD